MKEIRVLTSELDWRDALAVLKELRPEMDITEVLGNRESLITRGYKLYGLQEAGRFLSVAGIAIQPHISRQNDFWVHDIATLPEARSRGLGEALMRFLEQEARKLGCGRLSVHTRVERERAQNFYQTHLGYRRYAIVFEKSL